MSVVVVCFNFFFYNNVVSCVSRRELLVQNFLLEFLVNNCLILAVYQFFFGSVLLCRFVLPNVIVLLVVQPSPLLTVNLLQHQVH